jgi:hypothetical protein
MDITHDDVVEQFRASGLTQSVFCIDKKIRHNHLRYLLYKKNKTLIKALLLRKELYQRLSALKNRPFETICQPPTPLRAPLILFTGTEADFGSTPSAWKRDALSCAGLPIRYKLMWCSSSVF